MSIPKIPPDSTELDSTGIDATELASTAPNSTEDGPIPLPDLQDIVLSPTDVLTLGRQIEANGTGIAVTMKGAPNRYAGESPVALWVAINQLLQDRRGAMQIRYHYDGQQWVDTIMVVPTGFRVVRMAQG